MLDTEALHHTSIDLIDYHLYYAHTHKQIHRNFYSYDTRVHKSPKFLHGTFGGEQNPVRRHTLYMQEGVYAA